MGEGFKLYSTIQSVKVDWLWYPYIPYGKLTILQGDPGDGKSTLMMSLIAVLSKGGTLPNGTSVEQPIKIIYQCSEDNAADTIKPRLESFGCDCEQVGFIDESENPLTLDDDRLRKAIAEQGIRLLVIDPIQAYMGDDFDLTNAKRIRKVMARLSIWANTYNCAIVLVGHMNKNESSKDLYRGLGSIDFVAAARSVLQLERDEECDDLRCLKHIKSSLAPTGKIVQFELNSETGFAWIPCENKEPGSIEAIGEGQKLSTKQEQVAAYLKDLLKSGAVDSLVIQETFENSGVSFRTVKKVKQIMGVTSLRKNGKWYWTLQT